MENKTPTPEAVKTEVKNAPDKKVKKAETQVAEQGDTKALATYVENAFLSNPQADLLFFTSNHWAFFSESHAQEVAQTLTDKSVQKVLNPFKK